MISIVIPAYNEEKRIGDTLGKIKKYLKDKEHEIIVVDDGSTDKTIEIVKKYGVKLIKNKENMGKGYSVKKGILSANGDYILFSDADLSTPIEELDKFMKFINDYDIVIASRNLEDSLIEIKQPWFRSIPGKIFPFLVNLFLINDIKDTQCGFKLFRRGVINEIFSNQTINRFAFDVEILFIAKMKGYRIKELPVIWRNSEESTVKIFDDVPNMLFSLWKMKLNDLKGIYS